MGGSLVALKSDAATLALLTNPEVLDVDQHSTKSHAVSTTSTGALWTSERLSGGGFNVAFFNLQDRPQTVHLALVDVGLPGGRALVRDLWQRKDLSPATSLDITLPAHASVLYRLTKP